MPRHTPHGTRHPPTWQPADEPETYEMVDGGDGLTREADAVPPVAEHLTALLYDAHVPMCRPSKGLRLGPTDSPEQPHSRALVPAAAMSAG